MTETEHISTRQRTTDHMNDLFTSTDPMKVIEFYSYFDNREQLIQWMRERPKSPGYIHEVDGDREIIVVITTADFHGKYATECREHIFNGLHIIFVESGGRDDPYFNSAHNINLGMKKALEYDPKWIVFSSDDVFKIDDVSMLVNQLKQLNPLEFDTIFTHPPGKYHSNPGFVGTPNFFYRILMNITGHWNKELYRLIKKFCGKQYMPIVGKSFKKRTFITKHLFNVVQEIILTEDFMILSSRFVADHDGLIFDETYINGEEDSDISIRLNKNGRHTFINYRLGDYVGGTLGTGINRRFRSVATTSYFSYKIENGLLDL